MRYLTKSSAVSRVDEIQAYLASISEKSSSASESSYCTLFGTAISPCSTCLRRRNFVLGRSLNGMSNHVGTENRRQQKFNLLKSQTTDRDSPCLSSSCDIALLHAASYVLHVAGDLPLKPLWYYRRCLPTNLILSRRRQVWATVHHNKTLSPVEISSDLRRLSHTLHLFKQLAWSRR